MVGHAAPVLRALSASWSWLPLVSPAALRPEWRAMHRPCQIAPDILQSRGSLLHADGRPRIERPALDSRPRHEIDRGAAIGGIGPELSSSLTEARVDRTSRQLGIRIESCQGGRIAEDVVRISHIAGSVAFI